LLLRTENNLTFTQLLCASLVLRIAVSTDLPWLSDDFYRFLWDGQLLQSGIHPLAMTPEMVPQPPPGLFERLNSPHYYSVYPLVCQFVFFLGAYGKSYFASVSIIRTLLLAAELTTITILARKLGTKRAAIYALHPLAIIEICGNLHFEGLAVCFLVAMAALLYPALQHTGMGKQQNLGKIAIHFALAVATKINPLLIAPIIVAHLKGKAAFRWMIYTGICLGFCFLPIMYKWEYVQHMGQSLNLYFRGFQINASVFYILHRGAHALKGTNMIGVIGPLLSLLTVFGVLYLAYQVYRHNMDVFTAITGAFLVHLLFSTTVHPWYILLPLAMSIWAAERRMAVFCAAWGLLVYLSYSHFGEGQYYERFGFIVLEYACLICAWMFGKDYKWSV
jgi:alpha-1,6-mannosyltransferase